MQTNADGKNKKVQTNEPLPGNPEYSADQDIYNNAVNVPFNEEADSMEEEQKFAPNLADGLDIPGSELDNADEEIGEEDEENNYYSLGGESHENLEEDHGE